MASTASPQPGARLKLPPGSRLKSKISAFSDFARLRARQESSQIAVGVICLALALFFAVWRGPLPFENAVRSFARIDAMDGAWELASKEAMLRKYYGMSMAAGFGVIGMLTLLAVGWKRLSTSAQAVLWRGMATLACSCALWIYMSKMQFAHIAIDVLMTHPGATPIFGHRLLFVWVADAFHALIPASSYLRCYYASQVVATLLTLYAVGRWSALFVGEALSWLGQVLAVVMISTCFGYRDFYDIGIVFFFACGFLSIYHRKYWWLPVIVTLGTLNHENVLLLILVAALLLFDEKPRRAWLPAIVASLLGYVAVRVVLQAEIPFHRQVDWRIWSNMVKPFVIPHEMAYSVLALGGWYVLGLMSLSDCDRRLRRLAWLFPLLFGVTLLFGQFHEPRQFDAFIPVLIAMLLDWAARKARAEVDTQEPNRFLWERPQPPPQETKAA